MPKTSEVSELPGLAIDQATAALLAAVDASHFPPRAVSRCLSDDRAEFLINDWLEYRI